MPLTKCLYHTIIIWYNSFGKCRNTERRICFSKVERHDLDMIKDVQEKIEAVFEGQSIPKTIDTGTYPVTPANIRIYVKD